MKNRIQKGCCFVGSNRRLQWLRIRTAGARTMVFVPPLIGGDLSQPAAEFRFLLRRGCDLFSFNYAGHGHSSGKFCLGRSLEDTAVMLGRAAAIAESERLSLDGIGICYSAIPLLNAIQSGSVRLRRLVLISAVPSLNLPLILRAYIEYLRNPPPDLRRPDGRWKLPQRFGEFMLPGVHKSRRRFGLLSRKRSRLLRIFCDLILDPRVRIQRPIDLPVLCLYGSRDRILQMYRQNDSNTYERQIRRICRRVHIRRLCADHRLQPPAAKNEARRWIESFLVRDETADPGRFSSPPESSFPSPG